MGVVRAERQHHGHEGRRAEHGGQPVRAPTDEQDEPRDGDERRQPTQEDEALRPVAVVAHDEVEPVRGEAPDLAQRAPAFADRAVDRRQPDEHAGRGGEQHADDRGHDRPRARVRTRTYAR